jgi:DNA repair photolyase
VDDEDLPKIKTEFFTDSARTILAKNDSPDIGFTYSINSYRGCEHGCSYCYARPSHEYLGLSAGLDFESKIFVKKNGPELLREQLSAKKWEPQVIMMSGITDCYQPAERNFRVTRGCLQVLAEFKNPVGIITKNKLICRDLDILSQMAKDNLVSTCLSVTSLDAELARKLEPRTSAPQARLQAVNLLAKAGVPVSINIAPVIPGLNDHEIPAILKAAAENGARSAGIVLLRLPYSVKDIFSNWLETHYPERKKKVLGAILDTRNGQLYNSDFKNRMSGEGERAKQISDTFKLFRKKYGLDKDHESLRTDLFKVPTDQMEWDL